MREGLHPSHRLRLIASGLLLLLATAAMDTMVPIAFGAPRAKIHITWGDLDPAERRQLESRFALSEATMLDDRTWAYVPLDVTTDVLRAIVEHPSVTSTDGIDRPALMLSKSPPLTERRGGFLPGAPRWLARAATLATWLMGALGCLLLSGGAASAMGVGPGEVKTWARLLRDDCPGAVRRALRAVSGWFRRGIPTASPGAAGLFRIVFGLLVIAFVTNNPIDREMLTPFDVSAASGAQGLVVRWLAAHPSAVDQVNSALVGFGLLFVLGVATPVSFAGFTLVLFAWACVSTLQMSHHPVSALLVTLAALLAARWGDGWSIDAWWRRRTGWRPAPAGQAYGYALWVPGFVFGVAFLAAAWSKLHNGGDWILNGTVQFHFVTDFDHAWVKWGPALTRNAAIAIGLSAAAVVIEAGLVCASFTRSPTVRLGLGITALLLLVGFALFQGLVWYGWWILLVSFLPWHRLAGRTEDTRRSAGLTRAQQFAALAIVAQQVFVSGGGLEARPFFSAYDMYSTTYRSREAYEAATNLVYTMNVETGDRRTNDVPGCQLDENAARMFRAGAGGTAAARDYLDGLVNRCLQGHPGAESVTLVGDRRVYDWERREFYWKRGVDVIGPINVRRNGQ